MKPKYRVEAFIVPRCVSTEDELSSSNEIDDVKAANKLKLVDSESEPEDSASSIDDIREKLINENVDVEEPIYDVPYAAAAELPRVRQEYKFKVCEPLPKIPARTSSLMSIDERGETDGILEEFCFHGYSAPAQRPEEVSEEIFKENWLRRLESLRERESILRDKETLLQERERLLFKKERELRILERLVRDKLKQADLYLKRCKSSQSLESGSNYDAKTRSSEGSRDNQSREGSTSTLCGKSKQNYAPKPDERSCNLAQLKIVDPLRYSREETKSLAVKAPDIKQSTSSLSSAASCEEKTMKNPPNSRSSLLTAANINARAQLAKSHVDSANLPVRNSFAGLSAYSSLRCKPRPKMSYDDLDSTLSADIGDSSYVVTSGKFDPEVFKKPYAFTRSSSERRTTPEREKNAGYKSQEPQIQGSRTNSTEDKVLKRLSDNILIAQDKSTKYLDYGLIDPGVSASDADNARHSYLNLERGAEAKKASVARRGKERPISWNEETNEWLRKKRQAYNLATKRIPNENFENKENLDDCGKRDKSDKCTKKKESKTKKFAIFR